MTWTGTSGWQADFLQADEQLDRQADRLRSLVGHRIVETWTVVTAEDAWWESLPVILRVHDGRQLEVCWTMADDLSITWDTIDVTVDPHLFDDVPMRWQRDHEAAARSVVGDSVTSVEAITWHEKIGRWRPRRGQSMTLGLWLGTATGGLNIYNAGDTNGLSAKSTSLADHLTRRAV